MTVCVQYICTHLCLSFSNNNNNGNSGSTSTTNYYSEEKKNVLRSMQFTQSVDGVRVHVHEYEVHAIIYITRYWCIRLSLHIYIYTFRIRVCFLCRRHFSHSVFTKLAYEYWLSGRPFSVLNFVCLRAFIALRCVLFHARAYASM